MNLNFDESATDKDFFEKVKKQLKEGLDTDAGFPNVKMPDFDEATEKVLKHGKAEKMMDLFGDISCFF